MAVRTKLVAGNWKMNGLRGDGAALAHRLGQLTFAAGGSGPGCQLLICPPASLLATVGDVVAGSGIARQQFRWAPHTSGLTIVKLKDYEKADAVDASTPYAAWLALRLLK